MFLLFSFLASYCETFPLWNHSPLCSAAWLVCRPVGSEVAAAWTVMAMHLSRCSLQLYLDKKCFYNSAATVSTWRWRRARSRLHAETVLPVCSQVPKSVRKPETRRAEAEINAGITCWAATYGCKHYSITPTIKLCVGGALTRLNTTSCPCAPVIGAWHPLALRLLSLLKEHTDW